LPINYISINSFAIHIIVSLLLHLYHANVTLFKHQYLLLLPLDLQIIESSMISE